MLYEHQNGELIRLTLDHHNVKVDRIGLEWWVKRNERVVGNDVTEELYRIPDHINVGV